MSPTPKIHSVYIDMDGVLTDFTKAAAKAHNFNPAGFRVGEWALEYAMGLTTKQFWERCQGHLFWEQLEWLPDGRAVLDEVLAFCSTGVRWWLISSPSDDIGSFSGKYAWLQRHLPEYRRKLILHCSKGEMGHPGALLIDDSDANCHAWRGGLSRAGGESILLPRWWNSEYPIAGGPDNPGSLPALRRRLEALACRKAA